MDENTSKVIAEHENTALKDDIFTQFIAACDQAQKTNDSLKAALQLSHQQGFLTSSPPLNGEDSFYKTAMSCRTLHLVTRTFLFGEVLIPSLPYLSDY
jgi:hypothetical protein